MMKTLYVLVEKSSSKFKTVHDDSERTIVDHVYTSKREALSARRAILQQDPEAKAMDIAVYMPSREDQTL